MESLDITNACFEALGAVLVWSNVATLLRDRNVQGVNLLVSMYYVCWGLFNILYYAQLGHWLSLAGDLGILAANATWLLLAWRFRRGEV
jgi:hypothetical protein